MRILVWNINNFSSAKINNPLPLHPSGYNLGYIVSTVQQSQADIFVVIEPRPGGDAGLGTLANGEGPRGLLYLLGQLRGSMPADRWCLVPPQVNSSEFGRTECVGVFWKNTTLQFTGPYMWPAGPLNATGPAIRPGPGLGAPYPRPWAGAVDPEPPPPLPGTTAAGQCQFFDAGGREIFFPDQAARRPFLTTFQERPAGRTLKLFSLHTTPKFAFGGLNQMLQVTERIPAANEVSVIIGDMNVDLNNLGVGANNLVNINLPADGFQALLPGMFAGIRHPTVLHPVNAAVPLQYLKNNALDYGFVRYGAAPAGPAPLLEVVDRVAATPPPFLREMYVPLALYTLPVIGGLLQRCLPRSFRSAGNYGHVAIGTGGTSDHLPILAIV
jgi:hypothetical protein